MHLHLPSTLWCSSNTFSSVQFDELVASGPTIPWNKMTSLIIDLPKKEKSKASVSLRSNKGMWLIYKACAPNHTNTIKNHIEVVGHDFFLHCTGKGRRERAQGRLWKNRAAPLWRVASHEAGTRPNVGLLSTRSRGLRFYLLSLSLIEFFTTEMGFAGRIGTSDRSALVVFCIRHYRNNLISSLRLYSWF